MIVPVSNHLAPEETPLGTLACYVGGPAGRFPSDWRYLRIDPRYTYANAIVSRLAD
jgi:hypothetical protein